MTDVKATCVSENLIGFNLLANCLERPALWNTNLDGIWSRLSGFDAWFSWGMERKFEL